MDNLIYQLITRELNECSSQLRHIAKRKKLLKHLTLNDNLTYEQYQCAMAWLNHSDLTVEKILEKIK